VIIIGFDVSSAVVGYCVLKCEDEQIKLIKCDYFKPSKKGSLFFKLNGLKQNIISILDTYKPDHVAIEDIAKFMPRISSAQTIICLAAYNRTVGLACYEYLGKDPELCNVMAIRHKLKSGKILPKKEEMPEVIEKHLNIKLPRFRNKNNKIKPETFDVADGCAVALYHYYNLTQ